MSQEDAQCHVGSMIATSEHSGEVLRLKAFIWLYLSSLLLMSALKETSTQRTNAVYATQNSTKGSPGSYNPCSKTPESQLQATR